MKTTFTDWANLPEPIDPFGDPYKPVLENAQQIVAYIVAISTCYVDEDIARKRFHHHRAVLRLVHIDTLPKKLTTDNSVVGKAKQKRYAKLDPLTMPPLLIHLGTIEDGNHRLRIGKKRRQTHFWCYAVE